MYKLSQRVLSTVKTVGRQSVLVLAASVSAAVLCAPPASADDAQIQKLEAEIQQIEARHQAEISSLRAEIRQLRKARARRRCDRRNQRICSRTAASSGRTAPATAPENSDDLRPRLSLRFLRREPEATRSNCSVVSTSIPAATSATNLDRRLWTKTVSPAESTCGARVSASSANSWATGTTRSFTTSATLRTAPTRPTLSRMPIRAPVRPPTTTICPASKMRSSRTMVSIITAARSPSRLIFPVSKTFRGRSRNRPVLTTSCSWNDRRRRWSPPSSGVAIFALRRARIPTTVGIGSEPM